MIKTRRIKERLKTYKKVFLQNWALFRASKIGLLGVGIMIAFFIIAASAPFMGLRDPLNWRAPESDTIEVARFWYLDSDDPASYWYGTAPINTSIAFRVEPKSDDARADRIYVATGNKLFAVDPGTPGRLGGAPAWSSPLVLSGVVSTSPLVINYGHYKDPALGDFEVYVGTYTGSFYAIRDQRGTGSSPPPETEIFSAKLEGAITGIAAFTSDNVVGRGQKDVIIVGTSKGKVYAFNASDHKERWNVTLGRAAIHLAGGPLATLSGVPEFSPAFNRTIDVRTGDTVFLGTGDGYLWALNTTTGDSAWKVGGVNKTFKVGDVGTWSSAPIVGIPVEWGTEKPVPLVYAASDDGWLYVLYAGTGDPIESWKEMGYARGGIPIFKTTIELDGGVLSQPILYGGTIFVDSSTGHMYAVRRDGVGEFPPGSVKWNFFDMDIMDNKPRFESSAWLFSGKRLLYAVGSENSGTEGDSSDDRGILYAIDMDRGGISWKISFNDKLYGRPSVWRDPTNIAESVWVGTADGDLYAYASTGKYLAPLPPSWTISRPYPSGNTYWLGTDAQGRDVYSQLLWGSRIALLVGFASAFFSISIGTVIGLVAGYSGGKIDAVLMRFTDVILVLPGLPLVIILAAVLGAGVGNIILVISLVGWPSVARVIRSEVLSLKERPFIESAKVTGASNIRIMFKHIAPNVMPLAFLYMTFGVSGAILTEAALSFIGLGDIRTMSWGIMLQQVQQSNALAAWWWLLPPGLAITLLCLGFFLVGRAFDEIVNPRLRKR